MRCVNLATQHSALPCLGLACLRLHTADTVATLSSCVCACVPRKWLHLKGICLYKILLFAIYTRRVLFHLSFYTHTLTGHTYSSKSVRYVYMFMIHLCACRYIQHLYILYAFGFCKCCFLITWHYIAYTYTHTYTLPHTERDTVAQTIK